MAGNLNSLCLFLVLIVASSLCAMAEARPLNAAKHRISIDKAAIEEEVFDGSYIKAIKTQREIKNSGLSGLYIEAIRTGGPSSGGQGHESITNVQSLEEFEKSGPSPGEGH